ncbi:DUF4148 domain-containing protein (plasmid) [Burkholderia thailandensis]|uniref:DUF4148 domain-containing protein n=1 Tax=Burkholderia thailandensis TaxID=57975 RepID=UPI00192DF04C|nr:DUF4148 domain-containing protein [Burkholderia thailandensis]MBS2132213.1 DUF4148 domain-containing protein [Burkholderia thailandensis]QRA15308.1 DUF4148 domain-containing protein [Burkholderia thailandensis]
MNIRVVAAIIVAATAATSAFADGGHGYPNTIAGNPVASTASITSSASMVSQSGSTAQQGKTREQVHQELLQAYHDGVLPTSKHDYPPSPQTIARNKELHNLFEPKLAAQH